MQFVFYQCQDAVGDEDLPEPSLDCVADLSEIINRPGLKFVYQNIRSLSGKLAEFRARN